MRSSTQAPGPNVSTLELHHTIRIDYPALEILTDPSERGVLHRPLNVQQRYQPLPLIADDDVYSHAGRDRAPATQFFSLYNAISDQPNRRDLCRFLQSDVREVTKFHGKTRLSVVLYMTPNDLSLMFRVRRKTTYFLKDGYEDVESQDYNLPYDEFFAHQGESQWFQDILHLITMKDDRSARYVQFKLWMLEAQDFPGAADLFDRFCRSWKPRRQPDYEVYLSNLITETKRPSSLLSTKVCKVCRKSFSKSHPPAALPCCNKLVAKSCLVEWCQSFNSKTLIPNFSVPSCPSCKTQLFTDPRTVEHLKFGMLADQYWIDKRFTQWENFERSCADLDKHHASRNNSQLTISPLALAMTWQNMLHGTTRHDDPAHLQPHRFPEFAIFEKEMFTHLRQLEGVTCIVSNLYRHLTTEIEREFKSRFRQNGMDLYLPPGSRGWVGNEQIRDLMWRDGFLEFVMRVLNRTLQFHQLRQCRCRIEAGVHWEGGRQFWNPDVYAQRRSETYASVLQWQNSGSGRSHGERI
ncbi:hypothetical protein M409DRAFT_51723 [Zasmidium cellare ATCC 36951]|uniref:RING-type domain-containing protein n=1 Tax=Zasmidium cellare ATCC 36951 TaxID=1080233 RepID=A0A6A6CVU2_ZASCE|nr:uncharacterized protein M409DRAFT_51723 [Zasmidium cellare ATCC 36951]KAF2169932.1 hypothetical protein M409DRAFT_51723 [Zasmidium cellare ATCC 36951]